MDRVKRVFGWAWPELQQALDSAGPAVDITELPAAKAANVDAKLDEIIAYIRNTERSEARRAEIPGFVESPVRSIASSGWFSRLSRSSFERSLRDLIHAWGADYTLSDSVNGLDISLKAADFDKAQIAEWHERVLGMAKESGVNIASIRAWRMTDEGPVVDWLAPF
jgi:hypothetical protein